MSKRSPSLPILLQPVLIMRPRSLQAVPPEARDELVRLLAAPIREWKASPSPPENASSKRRSSSGGVGAPRAGSNDGARWRASNDPAAEGAQRTRLRRGQAREQLRHR